MVFSLILIISLFIQINKMADRMYALLAIGIALSPTRLDENTMIGLKDRFGDQYAKMQRG